MVGKVLMIDTHLVCVDSNKFQLFDQQGIDLYCRSNDQIWMSFLGHYLSIFLVIDN